MVQNNKTMENYIIERYKKSINYYWKASRNNRKAYKLTRSLIVILGASVTLVASLSSANFIEDTIWDIIFAIASPVLAAVLTIVGGFAQSFHWGAAWRDMVLNAEKLEKEHDRYHATKPEERDDKKELKILNDIVISETQNFFQRILGGAKKDKNSSGRNDDEIS